VNDDIGKKLLLGGVIGVADQVGAVGADVFLADDVLEDAEDAGLDHGLVDSFVAMGGYPSVQLAILPSLALLPPVVIIPLDQKA
jgi:hypothetical protein